MEIETHGSHPMNVDVHTRTVETKQREVQFRTGGWKNSDECKPVFDAGGNYKGVEIVPVRRKIKPKRPVQDLDNRRSSCAKPKNTLAQHPARPQFLPGFLRLAPSGL